MRPIFSISRLLVLATAGAVACSANEQPSMEQTHQPLGTQVSESNNTDGPGTDSPAPGTPSLSNHRRIFVSQAALFAPQLSPDGRFLAFAGPKFQQIQFLQLPEMTLRPGPSGDGVGWRLQWQPDGLLLALSPSGRTLQADPLSGQTRALPDRSPPSLTPVAAASSAQYFQHNDRIWARTSDGTLSAVSPPEAKAYDPQLSPDGTYLVWNDLLSGIWLLDLATGHNTHVGQGVHPTFSQDSLWLFFNRSQDDGVVLTASELWAFQIRQDRLWQLTTTTDRIETWPTLSADSKSIVYVNGNELWMADVVLP